MRGASCKAMAWRIFDRSLKGIEKGWKDISLGVTKHTGRGSPGLTPRGLEVKKSLKPLSFNDMPAYISFQTTIAHRPAFFARTAWK